MIAGHEFRTRPSLLAPDIAPSRRKRHAYDVPPRIGQWNGDDVVGLEADELSGTKIPTDHASGHGLCVRMPEGKCAFRIGVFEAHSRPAQMSTGGCKAPCHRSRRVLDSCIQTPDHPGEYR
ncbi:hypothetical protein [Nocardia gamkensis]|uniref:Uncharacterized protein n=1 Tax=Nocardia gamkensis TaxID=352869 RepID=A0A7X6L5D5_9NOCA|nr:hypothetical protein [Nocardia gamkensis]NKY28126.1 hypothetical protein [Nocardia gamkensis]